MSLLRRGRRQIKKDLNIVSMVKKLKETDELKEHMLEEAKTYGRS